MSTITNSSILEKKIQIGSQTIMYIDVNGGPQTIVCVPGGMGTIWRDFQPQIEHFVRHKFRVIALDLPGYGKSQPPTRQITTDMFRTDANLIQHFLTKIGIKQYSLLGWCNGGTVSLILAAMCPNNVKNLIIGAASAYVTAKDVANHDSVLDVNKTTDRMKASLVQTYTETGCSMIFRQTVDTLKRIAAVNDGDICRNDLPKIQCPTLIFHGDLDPLVALEHAEFLHKNIQNSRLHRFPNGRHNVHLYYAAEVNQIIADFLNELHG